MAEKVILAEIEILFDAGETTHDPIGLVAGNTYKIIWDSVEYVDVAKQENILGYDAVIVGNLALVGATEPTDFPFLLGDVPEMGVSYFVSEDPEPASYTVAIYQIVADEPQEEVGIVIKNYSGVPIEYKGVEKVMFNTADGGKRVYSKGEALEDVAIELDFSSGDQTVKAAEGTLVKSAVIKKPETLVAENIKSGVSVAGVEGALIGDGEEVTVALDMSDGDMVIEPSDGKLFSSVTVEKPDTLIPENIAEGVDIAGIIGTFVAGGGGGNVKFAGGTFTGNGKAVVVTHNMGVVPDVVFAIIGNTSSGSVTGMTKETSACAFFGISSAIMTAINMTRGQRSVTPYSSTGVYTMSTSGGMESGAKRSVYNPTETTVTIGSSWEQTVSNKTYYWIAIGGLT